ncbi:Retrovirus-related Pol polyprotein from transposon RE1 [Bienertia sinuspersici]
MATNSQSTYIDPAQDPSFSYFVHPSDSQFKLVPTPFNGSAFNDWKRSVIIGLSAKNKLGFIDGSLPKPLNNDSLARAWERCNNTIISWFIQVLDPIIARSILYFETAAEVWNNLEERFGQTSGTQIYSLIQQITSMEQGEDSISVFITKLKMLWDELDATCPMPVCTCSNCSCGVTRRILKIREDERLTHFLMKLSPEYKIVRDNILLQHPLPTLAHAYRLLMQEEKNNSLSKTTQTDETMAFAFHKRKSSDFQSRFQGKSALSYGRNNQAKSNNFRRNDLFCEYCKISGHVKEKCWKLHSYPSDWKRKRVAVAQGEISSSIEGYSGQNIHINPTIT